MSGPRHALIFAILGAVLVAGCSDAGTKKSPSAAEGPEAPGSIVGVVVDEAVRPVAGANVTLRLDGVEPVQASENGEFAFHNLAPGTYILTASAPGFLGVQSTSNVASGETAQVRLQLPIDASPKPYHTTISYNGYMTVYAGQGQSELQAALGQFAPGCECGFTFVVDKQPTSAIFEATWTLSTPDPANQAEFGWQFLWGDDHRPIAFDGCFSPCYGFIEEKALEPLQAGISAEVLMTGPDVYPVVNQQIDMFLTLFYNGPAPPGWSLVNGDL